MALSNQGAAGTQQLSAKSDNQKITSLKLMILIIGSIAASIILTGIIVIALRSKWGPHDESRTDGDHTPSNSKLDEFKALLTGGPAAKEVKELAESDSFKHLTIQELTDLTKDVSLSG